MSQRKTAAERVAEYRTRAATIEEKERRKLLARSPQWMAVKRAIAALELANECIPEGSGSGLGDAICLALSELTAVRNDEIGAVTADGIGAL